LPSKQLSRPKEARDLHRLVRLGMWTKLRPGVREFLRRAAAAFELWIYTAGSRSYADVRAGLLVVVLRGGAWLVGRAHRSPYN
jgi:RNA polymerase II C-terminal domain phosphatase-like 3/4